MEEDSGMIRSNNCIILVTTENGGSHSRLTGNNCITLVAPDNGGAAMVCLQVSIV